MTQSLPDQARATAERLIRMCVHNPLRDLLRTGPCDCALHQTAALLVSLAEALEVKQAQIDALMLKHCPDEITLEQATEWARRQARISPQQSAAIKAALSAPPAYASDGKTPIIQTADGLMVRATDFNALVGKCAALMQQRERERDPIARIKEILHPYLDTGDSRTAADWAVAIAAVLPAEQKEETK
jgi:hypothetical protein